MPESDTAQSTYRVLFCGCGYGAGNIGDDAILEGLTVSFRGAVPGMTIGAISYNPQHTRRHIPELEIFGRERKEIARAFRWATHVVLGGGTLIADTVSVDFPVRWCSRLIGEAVKAGLPVSILGAGVSGGTRPEARRLVKRYYGHYLAPIAVRSQYDRDAATAFGLDTNAVHVTADPAFALDWERRGVRMDGLLGVNLVNEGRAGAAFVTRVAGALAEACEDTDLHLIGLCGDARTEPGFDSALTTRAIHRVQPGARIASYYALPSELAKHLCACRLVITMRLHILVFCTLLGVPCLPIAREPKTRHMVRDLGLPDALPLDVSAASLLDAIRDALASPAQHIVDADTVEALRLRARSNSALWLAEATKPTRLGVRMDMATRVGLTGLKLRQSLKSSAVARRLGCSALRAAAGRIPKCTRSALRQLALWPISPGVTSTLWPCPTDAAVRTSDLLGVSRRLIVIALDRAGDLLLLSAFLRELRYSAPDARIELATSPMGADAARLCSTVDEVLVMPGPSVVPTNPYHRFTAARRFGREVLAKRNYDLAVVPRWGTDVYFSAYLAHFCGAPRRLGFSEASNAERRRWNTGQDRLLTHVIVETRLRHEVEHSLELLKAMGGSIEDHRLEPWVTSDDEHCVTKLVQAWPTGMREGPLIAFAPGAGHPKREWPSERLTDVGRHLISEHGAGLVVVGGPSDRSKGEALCRTLQDHAVSVAGELSFGGTAALLRRCRLLVGTDSSTVHLAAAVGLGVVVISCHPRGGVPAGDNSPLRFGPWRTLSAVLQPLAPEPPCTDSCTAPAAHCIRRISTQRVIQAVNRMLEAHETEPFSHTPHAWEKQAK